MADWIHCFESEVRKDTMRVGGGWGGVGVGLGSMSEKAAKSRQLGSSRSWAGTEDKVQLLEACS